jgi:hypothetical protein
MQIFFSAGLLLPDPPREEQYEQLTATCPSSKTLDPELIFHVTKC